MEITPTIAFENLLESNKCLGCDGHKKLKRSVCWTCWKRLPKNLQQGLYYTHDDYPPAFKKAIDFLRT